MSLPDQSTVMEVSIDENVVIDALVVGAGVVTRSQSIANQEVIVTVKEQYKKKVLSFFLS